MIWSIVVDLNQIHDLGRDYPWPRPDRCLRCRNWRLWGHGFVMRYFDGFATALFLKCFRCPSCGCVITPRPQSHFPRIRSSKETIRTHLDRRLDTGRWPPSSLSRSRLRHWLAHLKCHIQARLTSTWSLGEIAGFDRLLTLGLVPVARPV